MSAAGSSGILVALDDSVRKAEVFDAAVRVARRTSTKVHLMRVLMVPPEMPPGAHTVPDGLEPMLIKSSEADLHELMAKVPDVAFGPPLVVVGGAPWRRVVEAARALDVELIVVGNHKHHGLDRVFESVAGNVINHTDRDVLVVRVRDPARGRATARIG